MTRTMSIAKANAKAPRLYHDETRSLVIDLRWRIEKGWFPVELEAEAQKLLRATDAYMAKDKDLSKD